MTENEFRIMHSKLIEYYQLIEMRLKAICATISANEEKGWFERMGDYENDPFGVLLQKTKDLQKQINVPFLSKDDFTGLDKIREKRNYWAHQCFGGLHPIVFYRGKLKNPGYGEAINADLNDAIEWDRRLADKCASF